VHSIRVVYEPNFNTVTMNSALPNIVASIGVQGMQVDLNATTVYDPNGVGPASVSLAGSRAWSSSRDHPIDRKWARSFKPATLQAMYNGGITTAYSPVYDSWISIAYQSMPLNALYMTFPGMAQVGGSVTAGLTLGIYYLEFDVEFRGLV